MFLKIDIVLAFAYMYNLAINIHLITDTYILMAIYLLGTVLLLVQMCCYLLELLGQRPTCQVLGLKKGDSVTDLTRATKMTKFSLARR